MALTLRLLGGLTTDEIARAFLVPEPTIAQRIVRAKRTLAEARVAIRGAARSRTRRRGCRRCSRSSTSSSTKATRRRRATTGCARRSARTRCASAASWRSSCPQEPEVHGLVALMEIQASRSRARVGPSGEPVLLLDQDRARWDQLLIRRGLAALERAETLGGARGPYALQAAIAACHARARDGGGDRLGANRRALRRARAGHAVARRRAQSRRGGRRWRSARRQGSTLVDALARSRRSQATTSCRASAATCSPSSVASARLGRVRARRVSHA